MHGRLHLLSTSCRLLSLDVYAPILRLGGHLHVIQVNATGVMPVIFSSTLMSLPTGLARYAAWLEPVAAALGPTGLLYLPVRISFWL
jgi:hypothetical protein